MLEIENTFKIITESRTLSITIIADDTFWDKTYYTAWINEFTGCIIQEDSIDDIPLKLANAYSELIQMIALECLKEH